jgi:hypothetical protein
LKEAGLLVGYPDGKFRGPRNATRYEMAVAIHATYDFLKKIADAHEARIKALEAAPGGWNQAEIDSMKAAIKALQDDVAMIKRWRSEIDELNRLAKVFERELAALGVDVSAMKKDIADLMTRVGILEKHKPAVDIHGDFNFVMLGGMSDSPDFGIGVDGSMFGVGEGSYSGDPVGWDKDLSVLHDIAFQFNGTNETGPQWGGTLGLTTMMDGEAFGNQSELHDIGNDWDDDGDEEWYIQDFWVRVPTSIGGMDVDFTGGRIGVMVAPYIFMRPDATPYYTNSRWDNGKWMVDGANLGFNFGSAKLNIFGGRTDDRKTTQGQNDIQNIMAGRVGIPFDPSPGGVDRIRGFTSNFFEDIDRVLGVTLSFPVTDNGSINLAYIWLASDSIMAVGPDSANGVNVLGVDARFNFGGPTLEAGYSQSNIVFNSDSIVDEDNAAWYARLGWNQDRWGVNLGYRHIEPQFAAPGWWGRIGIWWNPVDIQGFMADAHFDLSDSVRLTASGGWYEGTETTIGGSTGLLHDDELTHYMVGLAYKINGNWDFGFGYEHVEWDLVARGAFAGGNPVERWWNIGFGYTMGNNVGLKLLWQISDYDGRGTSGFNPFSGSANDRARGGVGVAQLSVKY